MATIPEMLQQFLCYGNSNCMQEFQQYAYKPMEGIFYAVFFPIVFIIIFVYIVSTALSLKSRGIKMLIAVAVFAFIILQGWYHMFMMLGQMWLFVIVILGFFWVLVYTFKGKKQEAHGRTGVAGAAGAAGSIFARIAKNVSGEERDLEREIEMALNELKVVEKAVESGQEGAYRTLASLLDRLHSLRAQYISLLKGPGGLKYGGKFKHYESKIDSAIKRLQHLQAKAPKGG